MSEYLKSFFLHTRRGFLTTIPNLYRKPYDQASTTQNIICSINWQTV